jgi:hypothetical protein
MASDHGEGVRRMADEAIVRDLAERGPFVAASDALGDVCTLCGMIEGEDAPLDDPVLHEPSCLWRRATERYPSDRNVGSSEKSPGPRRPGGFFAFGMID